MRVMSLNNQSITAIPGITVGHVTDHENLTGVTVVRFAGEGATAAASVQGAAPGTRETDLLEPGNLVERANAIVLSGGSAYGLDAASGVMAALEAEGLGLPVLEGVVVPIVPAAVLFDLQLGSAGVRPTAQWGAKAALDATSAPVESGNLGAGTGATVGKLAGPERATKGGLGNALREFDDGVLVGALAAVNAVGEVFDSATGQTIAGVRATSPGCYESAVDLALGTLETDALIGTNTTLGVIATNVQLSKAQLKKVAEMAHDGLARAVRPVHTLFDGDTIFAVSVTNAPEQSQAVTPQLINKLGVAAAAAMQAAILNAVRLTSSVDGVPAQKDW